MSEILSDRIPLELEGTPVSSIMIEKPFTCTQDCTISDVVRMLAENEVSSMPVIDERNQVVGFISDGDVMGAIAQHRAHTIFTGGDASMLYFDDQSLEQRIEDLKRENAQLREDLALSRRLEGFHWPWTRDRIKAQHLLPKSTV